MKKILVLIFLILGTLNANFWEDAKAKSSEYFKKAKAYDKEHNVSKNVKAKSSEYFKKAKAYDKEHNISEKIKAKSSEYFKSIF